MNDSKTMGPGNRRWPRVAAAVAAPLPSESKGPREIQTTVLPNGLRIVTESMPSVRSVSLGIWVGTGSRVERGAENGLSHFIEHMVFKGTANRSAEDIARSVDSIGGGLDAFTSKELVSFNTKVLDEHLPIALDILSDMVLNPLFREDDIEKEKGVILEEIKSELDQPEFVLHEMFIGNFWKGHGLGRPILGTRETVKKYNRELLFDFYNRVYTPKNIVITAAGSLDHETIVRLVAERFSDLRDRGLLPFDKTPTASAPIILKSKKSLEQVHITVGVPAYELAHEMRFALYVLNTVLGGGMSSRLFQNIREKQGLVYSVYSELNLFSDTGCTTIYAGTGVETARQVVDSIMHEIASIKHDLIAEEELRRAKDHLKGSLMLSLESTSSRMSNLARQELYFPRFYSFDEMLESIESVTRDEVQQVAQEFFQDDKVALAMLGRVEDMGIARNDLAC
ncbi:MAG TPA: pitrilysin family protein [Bryobacteraceae bacterium]|nr:pitrilysin family protein [Bryobacteraceae bacterium]